MRFHVRRHLRRWVWTDGTAISSSNSGNRGGWYPSEAMKGDNPVEAFTRVLWAYSTQGS